MKIIVNGEDRESRDGLSVLDLLNDLDIEKERVAVELNSNIIPRADLGKRMLSENDKLEIVTFVGGG